MTAPHKPVPLFLTLLIVFALLLSSALVVAPVSSAGDIEVTNTNNAGTGSLRAAIAALPSGATITFNPSLSGKTISLSSALVIEKELTIDGSSLASPITISGGPSTRVFTIGGSGKVNLYSLKIIHGSTVNGGGIYNLGDLTLTNCTLFGNTALQGGGIFNTGKLTINNSTISTSWAQDGGGVFNLGDLYVWKSTFTSNAAFFGGGIYNAGLSAVVTVQTSTFSGNSAQNSGGGIFNTGELDILNSTFYQNRALVGGGLTNIFKLKFINTIIAGSTGGDCLNSEEGTIDLISTHNLVSDGSCLVEDPSNLSGSPILGPLANNGGITLTHALLPGSPAIDAASNWCLDSDQRSVDRPYNAVCDIGAFEYNPAYPSIGFLIYLPAVLR